MAYPKDGDALDALERLDRIEARKRSKNAPRGLRKISQGVFDSATLSALYSVMRKGYVDDLIGIVSTGKEANVYRGVRKGADVAVKIYCVDASDFRTMEKYIKGDRRFPAWKNRRQLIYNWTRKELYNLTRAMEVIECPKPVGFEKNILVMEYIGDAGDPYPRLKDCPPENPPDFLEATLLYVRKLYKAGLVHGDLSEYNILNREERPCFIDFSMGVLREHPLSGELLERDVRNVLSYFRKIGVKYEMPEIEVLQGIIKA